MEHGESDGRSALVADFAAVFDSCAPLMLRFARRRLGDQDAAWDIVSDTFTAAWRHWDRRPAAERVLPWLYAIAGNAIRDQRRASGRRRRLTVRLAAAGDAGQVPDPADHVALSQSAAAAMARLAEPDREATTVADRLQSERDLHYQLRRTGPREGGMTCRMKPDSRPMPPTSARCWPGPIRPPACQVPR